MLAFLGLNLPILLKCSLTNKESPYAFGTCKMINVFKGMTDFLGHLFLGTLLLLSDTQIQNNGKEDSCGFTK